MLRFRTLTCCALLLAGCAALPLAGSAGAASDDTVRGWFRAAYAAALVGEQQSAHEAGLKSYVLYPYLRAARLRQRLARGDVELDTDVAIFLNEQNELPVARSLRAQWIGDLAKRGKWAQVLAAVPGNATDTALRCHALSARAQLVEVDSLREEVTAVWLSGQDLPGACDPAFDWLAANNAITPELIEQRLQLALTATQPRLMRALAGRLSPERAAPWTNAATLLETPAELPRLLAQPLPPGNALLLEAYWRLARKDSAQAAQMLDRFAALPRFSGAERAQLQRSAAMGLAYDHSTEAQALFLGLPGSATDAQVLEWRLRNALWTGNWEQARAWLEALPEPARSEPRWRYWRARALERGGEQENALALYADVAKEREYYGFLAADRIGAVPDLRPQALASSGGARALLLADPRVVRARELFFCDLHNEAGVEWRAALGAAESGLRQEAALLASDWGWYEQTILILAELGLWDDVALRYPLPYASEVAAAAKESGVAADWLYAVMRQESLYDARAVSGSDALGLMQVKLDTAKLIARRYGRAAPVRDDLFIPSVSLRYGSMYLADLLLRFKGRWPQTLAAYNAGPLRLPNWLPAAPMPADVWIENIPFNETRLYVQRNFAHRTIFAWRRSGKPTPLLPLMPDVTPDLEPAPLP